MSDEKEAAKAERRQPGVEKMLRQFLTVETGQGKTDAYRRGHEFNFDWSQRQRDIAFELMKTMSFEEAFEAAKKHPDFTPKPREPEPFRIF